MIDPTTETLLTPKQVARLFPGRSGKGVSLATVWRWLSGHGRRGVVLESIRVGGSRYSSQEAAHRFTQQVNAKPLPRRDRRGEQEAETVAKLLESEGF
jgi:hypothetical protein